MSDPISLIIILISFVKGFFSGIGSKAGQSFFDSVKERFGSSVADKISDAFIKASSNHVDFDSNLENQINIFEEDGYYSQLLYGFSLIDGDDLSSYHKQISKLFLIEIFKDETLRNLLFNEKLDGIKKDTIEIKSFVHDIKDKFIGTLSEYSFDKFISDIDFDDFPHYYIHRKITVNTDWFSENRISSFNELVDYCKNNQQNKSRPIRVLIIADGGIGKSVYLKYLAKDCAENKKLYPIYISLRDLKPNDVLKDYIERRYPDLKKIDTTAYDQLCLFLDGFDEIGDSSAAVKQIDDLCSTYSRSHVVLTSRRNSFFNQLPDFPDDFVFTLVDIESKDIEKYINTVYIDYNIDTNHFFKEVHENNFSNLIYNPFYLDVLINCYISNNNNLRISKKVLIDNLIAKRREKDKTKRPDLELEKPTTKLKVLQLGKRFAFVQALMDQRNLSNEDIARLFNDDFDLAINSLPIRRKGQIEGVEQWEFEHNIFLEHLVSDVLKDLKLEQILEYTTSNNKVKSKWRDIISHLLGILDKNNISNKELYENLINWLIKNDFELLLKVEDSHLSLEICSEIFRQIYLWYQEKTIWIDTNKIDIKQMALFGETKANVLFVFDDIINENKHYRQRINASLVFQHFNLKDSITHDESNIMGNKYIEAICNVSIDNPEHQDMLLHYLIYNFPFKDNNFTRKIIEQFQTTPSSQIISSILHLINNNDLQDEYIDLLIDWNVKIQKDYISDNYSITDSLNLCLFKLKESISYTKFFNALVDEELYHSLYSYKKDDLKAIIKNSISHSDQGIIISIITLASKYASWHSPEEWKMFEPFFHNEEIRDCAVKILLEILELKDKEDILYYTYSCTLARIVNENDLPVIFDLIDYQYFYVTLSRFVPKESSMHIKVLDYLKEKYNYALVEQVNPWLEREKNEFDILFNKEQFQEECLRIFEYLGEDPIKPREFYKKEIEGKYWNRSSLAFLSWFGGKGEVSKASLEQWLKDHPDYFDYYLNLRICSHIPHWNTDQKMPQFTDTQLQQIKLYYDKHISDISFIMTINKDKENSYSMSRIAPILITYMQRFDFDCPDHKLCEMLGNINADFDLVIKKIKDKKTLVNIILENIKNYKKFDSSRILQQCKYIILNNMPEIKDLIIGIIKDFLFSSYHKTEIIIDCIEKDKFITDIINHSAYLSQSQVLTLCKSLLEKNSSYHTKVKDLLLDIIINPEKDDIKLSAISILVWQKDEEGLRLLIDYCKEHSIIALYDPFNNIHIGIEISDNYLLYDDIQVLPLLMEFLELSLNPDILPKSRKSSKIENNITHLALLSDDNYIEVILTLEQFIENSKGKYLDVESLNFTINRINELYQEKQSKRYLFKEAQEISTKIIN